MKRSSFRNRETIIQTLIITVLLLASTQVAFADLIVTTGKTFGPYQTGYGGEFTLQQGGDLKVAGNYSANANYGIKTTNTFQSFCLEYNETIARNNTYNAVLNNAAENGGKGGAVNGRDPISKGTAWLYLAFAQGTLAGYDYTNSTTAGRAGSAAALQNTIWYLEDEIKTLSNRTYLDLAIKSLGLDLNDLTGVKADYTGSTVKVLNLKDSCGNRRQDQLVVTPIPAAAWLLGSGLMGLIGFRRRVTS